MVVLTQSYYDWIVAIHKILLLNRCDSRVGSYMLASYIYCRNSQGILPIVVGLKDIKVQFVLKLVTETLLGRNTTKLLCQVEYREFFRGMRKSLWLNFRWMTSRINWISAELGESRIASCHSQHSHPRLGYECTEKFEMASWLNSDVNWMLN